MLKNCKTLALLALGLFAALVPGFALAQQGVVAPPGLTDWDLYVYGNGRVVYDILMAIKMLMIPDHGETGFASLLVVMATIGFLVLAVAAGFDPGRNIIKLFTYILVVWGVTFATTKLTANVVIQDLARDTSTGAETPDLRVAGAPALVVLPAALTSEIGRYFTQVIETYFTMPGELKMSGQAVGQFNLFGKMMKEANEYVITSPELKKSLSAYAANCVVPALALGRIEGPVGSGPDAGTATGTQALLRTNDMMTTLGSAKSKSLLTKYYPYDASDVTWVQTAGREVDGLPFTDEDRKRYSGSGIVMSCESAFNAIAHDVDRNAQLLMDKGAEAWTKTGVMVPYEQAFQTMLGAAAAPGSESAAFGSPKGFIMQQALINSTNGAYRQAAIQTGNNELMQAAALAQAEVSQKSAWAAGFEVFNNMMGYVFTVLQAFIFAITPLIVIALMIPGLGSKIFANYAQILIWLTLWQPMLSLINFIITLFGSESISTVVSPEGGLSMANKALVTEKTNDLMVAAQFLGTMTPLISWGIVKGSMAFTEFISNGVGSAFATQAGATAATGNLSMNNMSLDNTSMNKYSTMMSSQVGNQAVSVGANAGAMQVSHDGGGADMRLNNAAVALARARQEQLQSQLGEAKAIGEALTKIEGMNLNESSMRALAASHGENSAMAKAVGLVLAANKTTSDGSGAGRTLAAANTAGTLDGGQGRNTAEKSTDVNGGATVGPSTPFGSLNAGYKTGVGNSTSAALTRDGNTGTGKNDVGSADLEKLSSANGASRGDTGSVTNLGGRSRDASERGGTEGSATLQEALQNAKSLNAAYTQQLSQAISVASTFGFTEGMSAQEFNDQLAQMNALRSSMGSSLAEIQARGAALEDSIRGSAAGFENKFAEKDGGYRSNYERLAGAAGAYGPGDRYAALEKRVGDSIANTDREITAAHGRVQAEAKEIQRVADERKRTFHVNGASVAPQYLQSPGDPTVRGDAPQNLQGKANEAMGKLGPLIDNLLK